MRKYVSYYRVSTARQGASGLGLEAQQATVKSFTVGGQLCEEFIEIESGKRDERPQLRTAIARAQQLGATLVIAKLDRLSRNAGFIFALRDSGVDFTCCDMPDANTMTVGIFAVLAQHERETTSRRTKDALTAKKARGVKLGTPANLSDESRQRSIEVRREQRANSPAARQALMLAGMLRKQGLSFEKIAKRLNEGKFQTAEGKPFKRMQVLRLLQYEEQGLNRQLASQPASEEEQHIVNALD
jgi:DNA invertase Pin-like site-specific DNA recombinase